MQYLNPSALQNPQKGFPQTFFDLITCFTPVFNFLYLASYVLSLVLLCLCTSDHFFDFPVVIKYATQE